MITDTEKNLHASFPATLLMKACEAAEAEQITLDDLVKDAVEKRLNQREFDEIFAFGKSYASARGLKPSDVEAAIAEVRFDATHRDQ